MFAPPKKQAAGQEALLSTTAKRQRKSGRRAKRARNSPPGSDDGGRNAGEKIVSSLMRGNPLVGPGISPGLSLLCYLWSAEQRSGRSSQTLIPDTILVRNGMPLYWFANTKRGMLELKPSKQLESTTTVLQAFAAEFQGPCALWLSSEDPDDGHEASSSWCTLNLEDVEMWIKGKSSLDDQGCLVKLPAEIRSLFIYEASWSPQHLHLTQNKLQQDGSLKRADLKVRSTSIILKIGKLCKRIAHLVASTSPQMYKVASMKLIIAHDNEGRLYVLGCTSIKMKAPGADRSGLLAETEQALAQELKHLTQKQGPEAKGGQKHTGKQSTDAEDSRRGRRSERDQLAAMELALSNAAAREKNQATENWRTLQNKFMQETPANRLASAFFSRMAARRVGEALLGRPFDSPRSGRNVTFKGVMPLAAPALRLPVIAAAKVQQSQKDAALSVPRPSKSMAARVVFPSLVNPSAADDTPASERSLDTDALLMRPKKQLQHGLDTQLLYMQRLSAEEAEGLARACKQLQESDVKVPSALQPARGLVGKSLQKQKQKQKQSASKARSQGDGAKAAAATTEETGPPETSADA